MKSFTNLTDNSNMIIGGVTAKQLACDFGTPLFAYDKAVIDNMIDVYKRSLEKYYGKENGVVLYASKAFSCKGIYKIIKSHGIGCDVVSGGELYTALSAGFNPENIYFHGNNKTKGELEFAIKNCVRCIIVDAFSEMDDIDEICAKLGKNQQILIRVNPGVEAHTHHYIQTSKIDSKFGFSIVSNEGLDAIKYALTKKNINLAGLHCHIGSQIFEKKSYSIAIEKMVSYYAKIKNELNYEFCVLNVGGGFGIKYNADEPDMSYADYEEFIKIIADCVKKECEEKNIKLPYLIIEPGRSIVAKAGTTLYTIGRIKNIKGVKDYIAIDGGMFENPRFALYQAKYTVIAPEKIDAPCIKKYSIAGKCCESGDIIAEDVMLPEMQEGELLAVLATGAYNYSMASNYNRNLVPPVVIVDNNKAEYLVKPQTYEDLIRNDL